MCLGHIRSRRGLHRRFGPLPPVSNIFSTCPLSYIIVKGRAVDMPGTFTHFFRLLAVSSSPSSSLHLFIPLSPCGTAFSPSSSCTDPADTPAGTLEDSPPLSHHPTDLATASTANPLFPPTTPATPAPSVSYSPDKSSYSAVPQTQAPRTPSSDRHTRARNPSGFHSD